MIIIKKSTVAVDLCIRPFSDNKFNLVRVESFNKISTLCALYTMICPYDLFSTVKDDRLHYFLAGMIGSKTFMFSRVPVLCGYDQVIMLLQVVHDRNDLIASWNS